MYQENGMLFRCGLTANIYSLIISGVALIREENMSLKQTVQDYHVNKYRRSKSHGIDHVNGIELSGYLD